MLAAHRYKLSYEEIKEVVKNSIRYSLLEDRAVKDKLLAQLDEQFMDFEEAVMKFYMPFVTTQKEGQEPELKMMNLSMRYQ